MPSAADIIVSAGDIRCPVIFSRYRRRLAGMIPRETMVAVISNPTIFALHGRRLMLEILPAGRKVVPIMMGDGERFKSQSTVNALYDHLLDIRFSRHDFLVVFGGGVVGDTAGYVAATYKRGVALVQCPTTLVAMVDAAIGGKVGINHSRGKNLIGAFHQPLTVMIDPQWLHTLNRREMVSGFGEILKVGFLASPQVLHQVARMDPSVMNPADQRLHGLIRQAITIKAGIVSDDPYDYGRRAILNFGHTFAHAIEAAEGYRRFCHGEAVLAGMVGALYLSHAMGKLSPLGLQACLDYLRGFMLFIPRLSKDAGAYIEPMQTDKKATSRRLRVVLLAGMGRPVISDVDSIRPLKTAVKRMMEFVNSRGSI